MTSEHVLMINYLCKYLISKKYRLAQSQDKITNVHSTLERNHVIKLL